MNVCSSPEDCRTRERCLPRQQCAKNGPEHVQQDPITVDIAARRAPLPISRMVTSGRNEVCDRITATLQWPLAGWKQ
jgi:hypothetical protein